MHEWAQETYKREKEHRAGIYQLENIGDSLGLVYDARMTIPELALCFINENFRLKKEVTWL